MIREGLIATSVTVAVMAAVEAQVPDDLSALSGAELYRAACANCHGFDGTGLDRSELAFAEPLPDFTDCNFAAREPDADWVGVAHEGGPSRGFSAMMPAFGDALTSEQLQRVIDHVRTLCDDPSYPRGELNLPRALLTEKAYPEDEWVVEAGADLRRDGAFGGTFVYEKRFGARTQIELALGYGWRPDPGAPEGVTDWVSGLGDAVLGVKHALYHDARAGRILSLGGEVILPTGDEARGFGAPGSALEGFASFGQILPASTFFQAQTGVGVPLYDGGEDVGFARGLLGWTYTQGRWGRAWTPMLEAQVARAFRGGAAATLDLVPQLQVSLNTRQHVLANLGLLVPVSRREGRSVRLLAYVLLDWFDGGFFEGW